MEVPQSSLTGLHGRYRRHYDYPCCSQSLFHWGHKPGHVAFRFLNHLCQDMEQMTGHPICRPDSTGCVAQPGRVTAGYFEQLPGLPYRYGPLLRLTPIMITDTMKITTRKVSWEAGLQPARPNRSRYWHPGTEQISHQCRYLQIWLRDAR